MQEFLTKPQRDKHQNRYRASDYDLDIGALHARFAGYMDRFNLQPEARP